ncbi:hypothetical protein QJQ45_020259, partial [Haematococcus lacustris]
ILELAAGQPCSPGLRTHLVEFFGAAPSSNHAVESSLQHTKHGNSAKQGLDAMIGSINNKLDPGALANIDLADFEARLLTLRKQKRDKETTSADDNREAKAARKTEESACMVDGNAKMVLNVPTHAPHQQLQQAFQQHARGADYSNTSAKEATRFTREQLRAYLLYHKVPPRDQPVGNTLVAGWQKAVQKHIAERGSPTGHGLRVLFLALHLLLLLAAPSWYCGSHARAWLLMLDRLGGYSVNLATLALAPSLRVGCLSGVILELAAGQPCSPGLRTHLVEFFGAAPSSNHAVESSLQHTKHGNSAKQGLDAMIGSINNKLDPGALANIDLADFEARLLTLRKQKRDKETTSADDNREAKAARKTEESACMVDGNAKMVLNVPTHAPHQQLQQAFQQHARGADYSNTSAKEATRFTREQLRAYLLYHKVPPRDQPVGNTLVAGWQKAVQKHIAERGSPTGHGLRVLFLALHLLLLLAAPSWYCGSHARAWLLMLDRLGGYSVNLATLALAPSLRVGCLSGVILELAAGQPCSPGLRTHLVEFFGAAPSSNHAVESSLQHTKHGNSAKQGLDAMIGSINNKLDPGALANIDLADFEARLLTLRKQKRDKETTSADDNREAKAARKTEESACMVDGNAKMVLNVPTHAPHQQLQQAFQQHARGADYSNTSAKEATRFTREQLRAYLLYHKVPPRDQPVGNTLVAGWQKAVQKHIAERGSPTGHGLRVLFLALHLLLLLAAPSWYCGSHARAWLLMLDRLGGYSVNLATLALAPSLRVGCLSGVILELAAGQPCSPGLRTHLVEFFGAAPSSNHAVESSLQHTKHGNSAKQGLDAMIGSINNKLDPGALANIDLADFEARLLTLRKQKRDKETTSADDNREAKAARKTEESACMVDGNAKMVLNVPTHAPHQQLQQAFQQHARGADYSNTSAKEATRFTREQLRAYLLYHKVPPRDQPVGNTLVAGWQKAVQKHIAERGSPTGHGLRVLFLALHLLLLLAAPSWYCGSHARAWLLMLDRLGGYSVNLATLALAPSLRVGCLSGVILELAAGQPCSPGLRTHLVEFFGAAPSSNHAVESSLQHTKHGNSAKQGLDAMIGSINNKLDPGALANIDLADFEARLLTLRKQKRDKETTSADDNREAKAARKTEESACMVDGNAKMVLNVPTHAPHQQLQQAFQQHARGADYSNTSAKEATRFTREQLRAYLLYHKVPPRDQPVGNTLVAGWQKAVQKHIAERGSPTGHGVFP